MTQAPRNSFKRNIRVCYPAGTGTLVLRTDLNWEQNIDAVAVSSDGNTYFKPCLIKNGSLHWAVGPNNPLVVAIFENRELDFSKNRAEGDDLLGDAYEYLMRRANVKTGAPGYIDATQSEGYHTS